MQQNCKKGLCLAFLFSAMFLTGWEIAGMRSRQTKETAAVAYEAGNWGLGFGAEGTQPTGNATSAELAQYDAHYVGDPSGKVLYLTFDCGYENGNTEPILDALKKHQAPATFFVVGHFLESAPEIAKRMVAEGHTVGNHTYHHPDMSSIADLTAFQKEMDDNAALFSEVNRAEDGELLQTAAGKIQHEESRDGKTARLSHFFLESCLCGLECRCTADEGGGV